MIHQHSCRAGFSLRACEDLVHTGQAYSAAEYQRAIKLGDPVRASMPFTPSSSSRVYG